jgi:HEAT repeat protein
MADYAPLSEQVVPWITEAAQDPDERVTLAAVSALGQLEDERALPTLEKLKTHPNQRVRVYAEEAIARIRPGLDPKK